ncbi:MAG: AAA family ATPase [Clostridiales bacterium]|nr:AAA family ATPase [Clostridiales bacterium]
MKNESVPGLICPEREFFLGLTDPQIKTLYKMICRMRKQKEIMKTDASAVDAAYAKLDRVIGVEGVKKEIRSIAAYAKFEREYARRGVETQRMAMHMAFLGGPGTAKTTVARIIPDIFYAEGIIPERKYVEVGKGDMVARYVGHTPGVVKEKFKQADGGVLFVDEAYSLDEGDRGGFGDEAITTLITEMENKRDRVIVILAGYPDRMREFLRSNPGTVSRVSNIITFPGYTVDELIAIARLIAEDHCCKLGDGVEEKLRVIFTDAMKDPDFGNGRYVRSLVERALRAHAVKFSEKATSTLSEEELFVLDAEDFTPVPAMEDGSKRSVIGF